MAAEEKDEHAGDQMARLTFIWTVLLAIGFVSAAVFFVLLR